MTSTQASAPDLPGRWGRKHSPVPGGCQYCGTACGQRDCPPVMCLACGSRQCGGTHGGRCIVCSGGLLHPFDPLTGAPLLCGYADCQAPAVSAAPRIGRVCGGHLDRVTLRAQGTWRQSLANWIQDKIAERDIGGPDLIWIGPAGPAPAVRLQAGELRPGDRIYTASRWRTITGTRTESAGRAILTCDPEPGRLGPRIPCGCR